MRRLRIAIVLLMFAAISSLAVDCYATSVDLPPPDADWAIQGSAGPYGLIGYDSVSYLCWGNKHVTIPLHAYTVAVILSLGLVLLICLSTVGIGQIHQRKSREQS